MTSALSHFYETFFDGSATSVTATTARERSGTRTEETVMMTVVCEVKKNAVSAISQNETILTDYKHRFRSVRLPFAGLCWMERRW